MELLYYYYINTRNVLEKDVELGFLNLLLNVTNERKTQKTELLGCKTKANCPLVGPGSIGGVPSVGVFLRDPCLYLSEFRRKLGKIPNE